MLNSYNKQATENIRKYIVEQDSDYICERSGYTIKQDDTDELLAYARLIFKDEMKYRIGDNYNHPGFVIFEDWAWGLALGRLFCYYYNRSAVDDLGEILEETEEQKKQYTESQAEKMLTRLIYREMEKAYNAKIRKQFPKGG